VPTIPEFFAQVSVPFLQTGGTRKAFVTHGIDNQGAFTTPEDIAEAVWGAWETNMLPRIDTSVFLGPVHVQMGTGAGILSGDGTSSAVGGSAASSPPPQVAILIRKATGVGGRQNRGRMYLPWACDEGGVSELGILETAVISATNDAFAGYLADLDTAGVPMCLLHTGSAVPTRVISGTTDSLVATQRRRLGR